MKRYSGLVFTLALLVPGVASAQKKPSNNMHTRSALVYLENARKETVEADRTRYYQQALEVAQEGARKEPDNARVWLLMGQAQLGLEQLAAADSAFDRAEQLYPEYAQEIAPFRENAWVGAYNGAISKLQAGDIDGALAGLQQADLIYQGRPEALVITGQLHHERGNTAEAEHAYRAALAVLRGPARQGLDAEEEQKWQKNEEEMVERLAGLYADSERHEEAATLYREFLQQQPDNVGAQSNLAVVLTRMGREAEAAPLFNQLLERQDLDGSTLFNIGVGLFRAEQYEPAVRAFERAATATPHSHDAVYNLGQAIYAHTSELEDARKAAPAAEAAKFNQQLAPLYTRMGEVAERLLAMDPANANMLMMLAHSQRGRAEVASDKAAADKWRRAAMGTLERHQALPFDVGGIQLVHGDGSITVMGRMLNLKAAEGSPLRIRFMLLDAQGNTVAAQEVSAPAAAAGEPARFTVDIEAPETATYWKYELLK